jgi:DNA repair protein RadA/Sms
MPKKNSTIYLCENCGNEFSVWSGKCSMCGEWNTLKEVRFDSSERNVSESKAAETTSLSDIKVERSFRMLTNIYEFDRVLGGGIVPGSIILIGGEPGIGKSTLLLQVADKLNDTLYVSAEESANQIKIRAERLGICDSNIRLCAETEIESVMKEAKKSNPKLLIIDSIQTVYSSQNASMPGSLVQVRECGMILQQFAKRTGIPVVIVGHVTKDGSLAGPRILEHLVDVVLYMEGERYDNARILRGVKNRFGATNEVGVFSMEEKGMVEIKNPSLFFLNERRHSPGSAITITLEGTRPILVEIQALVIPTNFGYPKRTSSGFDLNRLNILAAVITKNTPVNLSSYDIYLNIIGGIKLTEPAVDLSICAAIISSYKNKKLPLDSCFFGEVGLLGEVRKVSREKDRQKEAKSLGYAILPQIKSVSDIFKLI